MKKQIVIFETYGIVAIYKLIEKEDEVINSLDSVKEKELDEAISKISELVNKNQISLMYEVEYGFNKQECSLKHNIIYHLKF